MYLFYFDESGNTRMNAKSLAAFPWFALGAVGIHVRHWWMINSALTDLKTRFFPGVPLCEIEIKSTALRSWGTPRARWPWSLLRADQAHDLVQELYALYAAYDLPLFAVGVDKIAHRQTSANPPHPYEMAFATLLQHIQQFLTEQNEIGLCFLDEFKGMDRQVIGWYTWRRQAGQVSRIIERPAFVVSQESQMISLADVFIYNVYRRFREDDPTYPYFVRLAPQLRSLVRLPENKRPPETGSLG